MSAGRSFKLGVIRLTERFIDTDPISNRERRKLVRHVRRETRAFLRQISKRRVDRIIGTSGTILSLGALAAGARPTDDLRNLRVSAKALSRTAKRLTEMNLAERLKLENLDPRRADLAPAGALLLDTILEGLDAEEITLCDFALREGLVLDYVKRNGAHISRVDRYPDVRRRSVIELAERYNYYPAHAQQVARLALALFDATVDQHELGSREREWLEYGALLHDVGVHISYEKHHRHSYYLIKNGDLRGFDPVEIELIALIARYHRQTKPKKSHEGYGDLTGPMRRTVRTLAAMVRLAEGLDRSHSQALAGIDLYPRGDDYLARLRATGDAELELWAAHRHGGPLEGVLDKPIRFEVASSDYKDQPSHAQQSDHAARVPRKAVRRRGNRRVRKDHAAGAPGEMA
jgi:exopolyphosphatase/guanosine-5'-triphosphate,3'-diphosphate pyrophosphatase